MHIRIRAYIGVVAIALFLLNACSGTRSTLPGSTNASNGGGVANLNDAAEAWAMHDSGYLTEFDVPGATTTNAGACAPFCGTIVNDLNDEGVIVGAYTDAMVVPHAFIRRPGGTFSSFDAPGAGLGAGLNQGTVATAINDQGVITGQLQDSRYVFHGFVRSRGGSFTEFDVAGAGTGPGQGTYPDCINIEGAIVGNYIDASSSYHGFVRSPSGAIATFDPSGSVMTGIVGTGCINREGAIAGWYFDGAAWHGFERSPSGIITSLNPPASAGFTISSSINDFGVVSGYYVDSTGVYHGFRHTPDGKYFPYDAPNAALVPGQGTVAGPINLLGTIAGEAYNASGVESAFSGTIFGTYATFNAPGAGAAGSIPSRVNLRGTVAGTWSDPTSLNHGFVWQPPDEHEFTRPAARMEAVVGPAIRANLRHVLRYPFGTVKVKMPSPLAR